MSKKSKIYIASPLGFTEAGRFFLYDRLIPCIEEAGYLVINPWELTDSELINSVSSIPYSLEKREAWQKVNWLIGHNNARGIEESDIVAAILDGSDVDSGTAAEIGFASAREIPVIGYRNDFRMSGDNEGSRINLQIEYFISISGGMIVTSLDELIDAITRLIENTGNQ